MLTSRPSGKLQSGAFRDVETSGETRTRGFDKTLREDASTRHYDKRLRQEATIRRFVKTLQQDASTRRYKKRL
ncbi:hypothetical protein NHX12_021789 [Muraenolepis orangiensis]|uniref:Uncharacterized protein n=1 Tax=Muraenolepis orangiensis TaxID=630683 RepID=A0A9Q0EQR9_9TELE|nr:hypothetical protein NHX12_021789 [Muraenolepis orangiensis]